MAQAALTTEFVVSSLEMLSGRSNKEYDREAEAVGTDPDAAPATGTNGAATESLEAVVAM